MRCPLPFLLYVIVRALLAVSDVVEEDRLQPPSRLSRRMFSIGGKSAVDEITLQDFSRAPKQQQQHVASFHSTSKAHKATTIDARISAQRNHEGAPEVSQLGTTPKAQAIPTIQTAETCVSILHHQAERRDHLLVKTDTWYAHYAQFGLGRCHPFSHGTEADALYCRVGKNSRPQNHGKPCWCKSRWCENDRPRAARGAQCWCDLDTRQVVS